MDCPTHLEIVMPKKDKSDWRDLLVNPEKYADDFDWSSIDPKDIIDWGAPPKIALDSGDHERLKGWLEEFHERLHKENNR